VNHWQKHRKHNVRSKSAPRVMAEISSSETCLLGERPPVYRWHESNPGLYTQLRELSSLDVNREGARGNDSRPRVGMPGDGAELSVRAKMSGNALGAKGQRQYWALQSTFFWRRICE
jgi:hypothetical protein